MKQKQASAGIKLFKWIMLLLNIFAIGLLLLAYLSYHIKPSSLPYIAFAGLAYPFILLLNAAFVVFWGLTRYRYALIPLLFILAGWNHIGRLIQIGGDKTGDEKTGQIKVLSYNIQNFLKINTSTTKYVTDFQNEENIIGFLKDENADIVCIQEMLNDRTSNKEFTENIANTLNCKNYHYVNYFSKNMQKLDAIATFTRFPVINRGELDYDEKSIGIFTDLIIHNDTVRVYNLHLASIHFKQEDYEFWLDIANNQEQEKLKAGTRQIMSKIQVAFIKRSGQSELVAKHIEHAPYRVIICGDFNDTPSSFAYNVLSEAKKDAFVESGSGLGITYAGKYFPSFRIDYILHDEAYRSSGFQRHKIPYSDHYPISTNIYLD